MRRDIRLRRSADFDDVRAHRSSWAHPLLVCARRQREDDGETRVGIVVGRRVGNAVVRNRVKRRVREVVRRLHPRLQSRFDVVFIARPAAAKAPFADLAGAVETLFGRARLWRPVVGGRPADAKS